MAFTLYILACLSILTLVTAAPLSPRANACFIIGSITLPQEVIDTVTSIQSSITCSSSVKTISSVPDVTSGTQTFSSIDFSTSTLTPLAFALSKFATASTLGDTDLAAFTDMLNVYQATEAGIRSVGGNLAIKAPKFFLSYQIARINTAQGTAITDPGQAVAHLLGKVTKNAGSKESAATLAAITALSTQLS